LAHINTLTHINILILIIHEMNKLADYVSLVISMVLHFISCTYFAANRMLKIWWDVRKGNIIFHGDVGEGTAMFVKVPN
jgi:hypothetical protein